MIIKVLFVILVLSTLAVIGVAIALFVRVKRHMKSPNEGHHRTSGGDASERTELEP